MTLTNPYLYGGSVFYNLVLLLRKVKKEIQLYTGLIGLTFTIFITFPVILFALKLLNRVIKKSLTGDYLKVNKNNFKQHQKSQKKFKKVLNELGEIQEKPNKNGFFLIRYIENEMIIYHKLVVNIEETLRNQLYTSFGEEMTLEEIEKGKVLFQDWDDSEEDDIYDELYYEEARN